MSEAIKQHSPPCKHLQGLAWLLLSCLTLATLAGIYTNFRANIIEKQYDALLSSDKVASVALIAAVTAIDAKIAVTVTSLEAKIAATDAKVVENQISLAEVKTQLMFIRQDLSDIKKVLLIKNKEAP